MRPRCQILYGAAAKVVDKEIHEPTFAVIGTIRTKSYGISVRRPNRVTVVVKVVGETLELGGLHVNYIKIAPSRIAEWARHRAVRALRNIRGR